MQQYKEYCAKKNVFDCEFKVYYNPDHDGGGPLFVDHIFSKKESLDIDTIQDFKIAQKYVKKTS